MTSDRRRILMMGALLVLCSVGIMLAAVKGLGGAHTPTQLIILVLMVAALIPAIVRLRRQSRDEAAGIPLEDEMTRELRVLAGARAFHLSMYLWLGIFLFQTRFSDREEMLGVGILGSGLLFGLCWLHLRIRGLPRANQD